MKKLQNTFQFTMESKGFNTEQIQIIELATKGLSNEEIANQLFKTERVIKTHLNKIYKQLQIKSRVDLILLCLPLLGFIESEV
jgi:DNA-binding NarL/FixJ family response regulator